MSNDSSNSTSNTGETTETEATQSSTSPQAGGNVDEHDEQGSGQYDAQAATEKIRKLNSEARNLRARVKELEPKASELDKLNEAKKSEVDKLTESNTELSTKADNAERELLRYKAAVKAGVAVDDIETFASRLQGNNAEELEADAAELKKLFASNGTPGNQTPQRKPDRSQGAGAAAAGPAQEFAAFMQNLK